MKTTLSFLLIILHISLNGQTHNIGGIFPTIDFKYKVSEKLEIESFSFLTLFPVEQTINEIVYPRHSGAFYTELDFTYLFKKNTSITGSYTYERANPFGATYRNENRVWFQMQQCFAFTKWNLKSRIRYDARFIQNRITEKIDFSPRIRSLIGGDLKLNKNNLYFAAYNEFFFNTYSNRISLFTENWAFAGLGFNVSSSTKLETGPLIISWIRNSKRNWLNQCFFQLTLITDIHFKK